MRDNIHNFSHEILENKIPKNKLKFCEDRWISKLNTIDAGLNSNRAFITPEEQRANTNISNLLNYYANQEARRAYQRDYVAKHPAVVLKNSKIYYHRHKNEILQKIHESKLKL